MKRTAQVKREFLSRFISKISECRLIRCFVSMGELGDALIEYSVEKEGYFFKKWLRKNLESGNIVYVADL